MRVRAEIVALYACSLAAVLLVRSAVLSADAGIPYFAYSTDVTVNLDGWQVDDEGIVTEEAGVVTGISGIPGAPQADLDAMHENDDGSILLVSVDSTVTLPCPPGPMTFGPGDVINFLTCLKAFSADDLGLSGVDVDAVSMIEDDLLLSFDVSVTLGSVEADDEDLVRWLYPGAALFFDGSAAGVPPELDLNAAHLLRNGHLLLSFDGSGTVGGIDFDDEDILEYDPAGSTWQLAWDGSARHPNELPPADIDALVVFEHSPTVTPTDTQTATRTRTATPTRTATGTATPTRTATRTATSTGTATSTRTGTPSWTGTGTASPTRSATPTVTGTGTSTRTGTHTATATHTVAGTQPPTATLTASYTRTPTPSPTQTATATQGVGALYCRSPWVSECLCMKR